MIEPAFTLDIITATAVVITLLILALELRLTRKQNALANWREVMQALSDYKGLTNDLALAEIIVRGHADRAMLSEAERLAFDSYLEQGIHIYGKFLRHGDAIPAGFESHEQAIANSLYEMLTTAGGAAWWADINRRNRFRKDTYSLVQSLLDKRTANQGRPL